ncbi:MAG TPA: SH3 domain-containing protein, partial [Pyrinomonadaceae bacterium]|nr:SH3 domain-containing protein [Pyrinomonadaceae bacterium]
TALLALLFALTPRNAPARAQSTTTGSRITTASNVRVRSEPNTTAAELVRLPVGVVVETLEHLPDKVKIGEMEDYWYLVSAPGDVKGWVFGGLTAPFDAARRDEIYRKLAEDRLANADASFNDLSDLVKFLDRAAKEVKRRDALASLELARLVALQRSLAAIPFDGLEKPPYIDWTKAREAEIVYSEPAGQWYVRAELLWELEKKYHDLPVAERIAWVAAETPLPGECEGYLPCYLALETMTNGMYLKLYPRGPHADAALRQISEFLDAVAEDLRGSNPVYEVPKEDRAEFQKMLTELRAQVAPAANAKKVRLLGQIDDIAQRFR